MCYICKYPLLLLIQFQVFNIHAQLYYSIISQFTRRSSYCWIPNFYNCIPTSTKLTHPKPNNILRSKHRSCLPRKCKNSSSSCGGKRAARRLKTARYHWHQRLTINQSHPPKQHLTKFNQPTVFLAHMWTKTLIATKRTQSQLYVTLHNL